MRIFVLILTLSFSISACGGDQIYVAVAAWKAGAALPLSQWESLEAAADFRRAFVEALENEWGPPVGFKAALTSPAAQARFGVDRPILGALLSGMILPNNAVVTVQTSRLLVEADLIVVVRDEAFNDAQDDHELVRAISHVAPFIELADGIFPPGHQPDIGNLIAYNAGARLGVRGALISLPDEPGEALAMLRRISATLHGPDDIVLGSGAATNLLGDPIRAVRWIRDAAHLEGYRFEGGEFLSLGSITPPRPAGQDGLYKAVYEGIPSRAAQLRVSINVP